MRKFLVCTARVSVTDLDDVGQEVFLRLLRCNRLELIEDPRAYLFRMASNVAYEWSIKARSRMPHESEWLADLTSDDDPATTVTAEETQAYIRRAIETLTPLQRQILNLQFAGGMGRAQIAKALGTTPRSVKRNLEKSYAHLRIALAPRKFER